MHFLTNHKENFPPIKRPFSAKSLLKDSDVKSFYNFTTDLMRDLDLVSKPKGQSKTYQSKISSHSIKVCPTFDLLFWFTFVRKLDFTLLWDFDLNIG